MANRGIVRQSRWRRIVARAQRQLGRQDIPEGDIRSGHAYDHFFCGRHSKDLRKAAKVGRKLDQGQPDNARIKS